VSVCVLECVCMYVSILCVCIYVFMYVCVYIIIIVTNRLINKYRIVMGEARGGEGDEKLIMDKKESILKRGTHC